MVCSLETGEKKSQHWATYGLSKVTVVLLVKNSHRSSDTVWKSLIIQNSFAGPMCMTRKRNSFFSFYSSKIDSRATIYTSFEPLDVVKEIECSIEI